MGYNEVPMANRLHIGIFGCRNAGKSSLINAITSQDLAIVSNIKGTTTDPVYKSMELLPIGPIVLIDTAGLDDVQSELGQNRVKKSLHVLNKTDIALLVVDVNVGLQGEDNVLLERIHKKEIPCIIVWNKCDTEHKKIPAKIPYDFPTFEVSATNHSHINELKEFITTQRGADNERPLISDLITTGDIIVLVMPIDESTPKGRVILPEQNVLRDCLDNNAISIIAQPPELPQIIRDFGHKIKLVITDSQAFGSVSEMVPEGIPLTSFSIVFARYKGVLDSAIAAAIALDHLEDGDKILISEGCTHHRQCNDIGAVKFPNWIRAHAPGKKLEFEFTSGRGFPDVLKQYKLVIHCGSCMLNEREVKYRYQTAIDEKIPITNYGIAIAHLHHVLARAIQPFGKKIK
ncbi:MAG: [FeFe] hydrogenase H-cluster maturation GTPase HydF [Lentisphaeria bacterium]